MLITGQNVKFLFFHCQILLFQPFSRKKTYFYVVLVIYEREGLTPHNIP
jgi:hypothetical protein